MYIGNTPFQGLVGGGNILDASIEGVDLSTSAIAARLGYTPVDPGAAVFSANPTISSGVANGVAYLNGSKVVTTGNALTFDGTLLKLGTTSSTNKLLIDTAVNNAGNIQLPRGGYIGFSNAADNANSEYIFANAGKLELGVSGSSRLYIDSAGRVTLGTAISGSGGSAQFTVTGNSVVINPNTDGKDTHVFTTGAVDEGTYAIKANTTTKVYLHSNGNSYFNGGYVGIGRNDPANQLDVYQSNSGIGAGRIWHVNGNAINIQPSYNYYDAYNHIFRGLNGTTEYGRFDNSGNFLIGTTYSGGKLAVTSSGGSGVYNLYTSAANIANPNSSGSEIVGANITVGANIILSERQPNSAYADRTDLVIRTNSGYGLGQSDKFRFTAGGSLGIGATNPNTKLDVRGTSNTAESTVQIVGTNTSTLLLGQNADGGIIRGQGGNNVLSFWTGGNADTGAGLSGTERMRITSTGNVLINSTSSNGQLLKVGDAGSTLNSIIGMSSSSAGYCALWFGDADSNVGYILYDHTNNYMAFRTNGAEAARFSDLGNFALGTTPNRWFSNRKAIQLGGSVGAISMQNGYEIGLNFYVAETTAAEKRVQSGYANKVTADAAVGDIVWSTAGTGSADSNITWGERLRLTNNGTLLIRSGSLPTLNQYDAPAIFRIPGGGLGLAGAYETGSSPVVLYTAGTERFRITPGGQALFGLTTENLSRWGRANFNYPSGTSNATIALQNSTARAANNLYGMLFVDNTDESNAAVYVSQTGSNNGADLLFGTNAGTGGAGLSSVTERMRVTAGGNVGVGTTSPNGKLEVAAGANAQHIRIGDNNHDGYSSTFKYPALSYYARRDNIRYNGAPLSDGGSSASIVFTDRPGTAGYPTNCRTSDIEFWTATNNGGTGLDVRPNKRLSIIADGRLEINGISEFYTSGFAELTNSFYIDVPVANDSTGLANMYHVQASLSHANWSGYGCLLDTWYNARANVGFFEQYDTRVVTSGNGGSWSISKPAANVLRITHNAGTYAAGGYYWIRVTMAA